MFRGYARQPEVRTVQGELEAALAEIFETEIETQVAGRTDAGVHALGQVVGAQVPDQVDLETLPHSIDSRCAPEIVVHRATRVPDDWHARFSARSRTYLYALLTSHDPDPVLARTTWQQTSPLDMEAMNEAAGHLIGHRDFSSFGRLPKDHGGEPMRTLFELRCLRSGPVIRIRARANAFIHQMVRSIVGTLVDVGKGKIAPDDLPGIIEARDRVSAGPVAPPHGLCLVAVEYDDGWSAPPPDGDPWSFDPP